MALSKDVIEKYRFVSHSQIRERGVQKTEWDIEGLIEKHNGPTLITAPPEACKSWFALFAAKSVVDGTPFLGHFAIPKKRPYAIFLNLDAGEKATENRVAKISRNDVPNLYVVTWESWDEARFGEMLADCPGAFVVLDCFSDMFRTPAGMDASEAMRQFLKPIRLMYSVTGCNGIIVDHTPRGHREADDSFYGSVQKKGVIRQGITMKRNGNVTEVHCLKMSEAEKFEAFEVDFTFNELDVSAAYLGPLVPSDMAEDRAFLDAGLLSVQLKQLGDGPWPFSAIQEASSLPSRRLRAALKQPLFSATGAGRATKYSVNGTQSFHNGSPASVT